MLKRTPLYTEHEKAGAKFVDFFGWELPIHYGSQVEEHHAVRKGAGMFDVSHMTIVDLLGAGGRQFLRHLLANDIDRLAHPGKAMYSCMLNHQGGIIDDLIVYFRSPDNYRLVLNAATREQDLTWMQRQTNGLSVGLQERPEFAMIAIQGPEALDKTFSTLTPAQLDAASTLRPFEIVDVDDFFIARTGYTGEDGFEVILPAEHATEYWQKLLEAGVTPCGLGARDTLRLEAGFLLSGQDMDTTVSPYESGLGWTVAMQPGGRDFIGRAALQMQNDQGAKRQLVGLVLDGKGIMRTGQEVVSDGKVIGAITSGGFSPTLDCSIALARVSTNIGDQCDVKIRDKMQPARVVKPRFVKNGESLL